MDGQEDSAAERTAGRNGRSKGRKSNDERRMMASLTGKDTQRIADPVSDQKLER
jgi:hypothetical protein